MIVLQLACLAIIAAFLAFRVRLEARPLVLFRRLGLLAAAAWLGEDTCIRAYGFYEYSPGWWLFLDKVPLFIILIWPIVIQSARDLAACLWPGRDRPSATRMAFTVFGLVLADASLIEPIAVKAGLWRWTEPGLFTVPPIGILGWAYFAALAVYVFERAAWTFRPRLEALTLVVAPAGAHLLLLASWWALFRWINVTVPAWPVAALAWLLSLSLAALSLRAKARHRIPPMLLWLRVPAALFFFTLLTLHALSTLPLVTYALAFAPPYLTLLSTGARRPAGAGGRESMG